MTEDTEHTELAHRLSTLVTDTPYIGPHGTRTYSPPTYPMEGMRVDATVILNDADHAIELVGTSDRSSEVLLRDVPKQLLDSFFDEGWRPKRVPIEAECFEGGRTRFIATETRADTDDSTVTLAGEFGPDDAKVAGPYHSEYEELREI